MDIQILADEITNDPLGRGYSGMDDSQVAVDMNTKYRSRNRTSMSGSEIWDNTDPAEFAALEDGADTSGKSERNRKLEWVSFCGINNHDPFGSSKEFVIDIFGIGTTTANLDAVRVETISRGVELELGIIKVGHVQMARGS